MPKEGPEGVKWELQLACFCPSKMDASHWDWYLGMGKKCQESKMGMRF